MSLKSQSYDLKQAAAKVALAIQAAGDESVHQDFLAILEDLKAIKEAARRVVRSRHDDLDTGSINWVAVLDCHLTTLADCIGEPSDGSREEVELRDALDQWAGLEPAQRARYYQNVQVPVSDAGIAQYADRLLKLAAGEWKK